MKKVTFASLAALFIVFACQKKDAASEPPLEEPEITNQITERKCASEEVLQQQMAEDPTLRARMAEIEEFTQRSIATGRFVGDTMEIPVVVNVVYNTTSQNISDAQIKTQIDVLNEDFQKKNSDAGLVVNTNSTFQAAQSSTPIKFVLFKTERKSSNKRSWGTDDAVKKTSRGGIDPYLPNTHLNMWVCNLGQNLLGYAQFPGGSAATDGVVVLYSAFGSRAKMQQAGLQGAFISSYDLGRTATHEVGHWLNLRHIWGDATCGNDLVGDTPVAQSSNGGCPPYPKYGSCSTTIPMMTMNYMDYTYDACMYMFSQGQSVRMMAVFNTGGPRASFR